MISIVPNDCLPFQIAILSFIPGSSIKLGVEHVWLDDSRMATDTYCIQEVYLELLLTRDTYLQIHG